MVNFPLPLFIVNLVDINDLIRPGLFVNSSAEDTHDLFDLLSYSAPENPP